jgi:hypothetical protein
MSEPRDMQDFTDVLKTVYLPVRKKAFPLMTPLLAQARRAGPESVRYGGHDLVFDVKLGRRGGFVSSTQGWLPQAKQSREKQGRLSIARTYATASLDGLLIKATQRDQDSYISAAAKVTEDMQEQWQLEQNRILHGDSLGVRAVVQAVPGTGSAVVHNPYGIAGAGPGNLHLEVGDDIAVVSADGATQRGKAEITGISLTGDLATLTWSAAVAGQQVGDVVVTAPPASVTATDNSWGAEPHGIMSILDVEDNFETFEGIRDDRWRAQHISSATVDELIVMRLLNTIRARAGIDWRTNPSAMMLLTTTGIWQTYGESLLGLRRFDAPIMTINGGFTGVAVAGAVLVDDPWAPRGRLNAIHGPDTIFIDLMDWGELSFQDAPTWQRHPNRDAWNMASASYWNYGCTLRSSHGVIHGITDTVNYSPIF